ncbi:polymeric immunoglobulin receptor-like [Astyanax mexicanus]|uniref:polymeric immunoglobulin receptor-like n=1 Tax=Astyanax mexicanus TaxID=7994 RepID=UPI0020CAE2F6|nr:polymeric immunoglobulin receptor-like [Astyanax mexicanus]
MKILFIFIIYQIKDLLDCVDVVGYSGRSVIINCSYSAEFRAQEKVLCRRAQICETMIRTNASNQWVHNDKFHLYDDKNASVITVFISNLIWQDAGTYRCAVVEESAYRTVQDWDLKVKEDGDGGKLKTVTAQLGHSVSFSCEYSEIKKITPKYLFKMQDPSAELPRPNSATPVRVQEDFKRLFLISDQRDLNMFRVRIEHVTVEDTGLYFCGIQTSVNTVSYVSAIRNIQLFTAGRVMIGYEGDVVQIRCPYASNYKQHLKHFCKENEEKECLTEQSNLQPSTQLQNREERFTLNNNITTGVFTLTIRGLTAEDAGKYWCAVRTGDILMKYLSNELKVIMKQELRVIGHQALNASINCISSRTIDSEKKNNVKVFCMGKHPSICDEYGVRVSSERNRRGRFSLSDDASSGIFTVSITDLREEDSGTYWCGEESSGSAIYTKVHLQVTKEHSYIKQC